MGIRKAETADVLLKNLDRLHTTDLGVGRIRRNLNLDNEDVVDFCRNKAMDRESRIFKEGKNWYCENDNLRITINARSYTIITAHLM